MYTLENKVALITGASRGIGKAIAEKFASAGAHIVFTHLSDEGQGEATAKALRVHGTKIMGYRSDASNFQAVEKLINGIIHDFGQLDIIVNNAGITRDNLLLRMDEQAWDKVLEVNLKSAFNTVKVATRQFVRQRSGVVLNIASIVGLRGNAGQANYAASKAGLIGFTKSVALELSSRNIRANAIAPGFIKTDMTANLEAKGPEGWLSSIPLGRQGMPEDVANCALFLASDAASYITGQVIQVDGGLLT